MSGKKTGLAVRESNGITQREEESGELVAGKGAAEAESSIQAAIVVAKRFPRDEMGAMTKLVRSCQRPTFAEDAMYSFPRGDKDVTGPSVRLAREAARCWGNVQFGLEVISDTEESRHVRAWAWDVEANTRVFAEDSFAKRVYRKSKEGGGYWKDVSTDEREMRELTNRRGAICVRNCILQLIPSDVVEEAISQVYRTLDNDAAADPDAARKAVSIAMAEVGVGGDELAEYLDKPLAQATPAEVATLKGIATSIRDGNSTWAEYLAVKRGGAQMPRATAPAPESRGQAVSAAPSTTERQPGDDDEERRPPTGGDGGPAINEKQVRLLMAIGRNAGKDADAVKSLVNELFACSPSQMTNAQLNKVLSTLREVKSSG